MCRNCTIPPGRLVAAVDLEVPQFGQQHSRQPAKERSVPVHFDPGGVAAAKLRIDLEVHHPTGILCLEQENVDGFEGTGPGGRRPPGWLVPRT